MVLEDIMSKIGSLLLLEKFVLQSGCFRTGKWETTEGQFPSLKFLRLCYGNGLKDWIVSDNFSFSDPLEASSLFLRRTEGDPIRSGRNSNVEIN